MAICQSRSSVVCPDLFGCPPNVCADLELRRHDTQPPFIITVSDCNGPLDLTNCIAEVSMWALANLKKPLAVTDTYFSLANNVGFQQSLVGDIIVMDRVRAPEQMLVIGHDENNKLIQVQRGYNGSTVGSYPRGNALRIFRVLNGAGSTNMVKEDIENLDVTVEQGVLTESQLIYNWQPTDTCLPGCYWFEFKLLNINTESMLFMGADPIIPTFASVTPSTAGCFLGNNVNWERRFPVQKEGFLIRLFDTQTSEILT